MSRKGEADLRKTLYGAAALAGLCMLAARAEDQAPSKCTYREEPVADATVPDPAKKDKHLVTLLAMSPVEGTEVRADSVLELDIEYHVAGFAADKFFFMVGFPTISLGMMSPLEKDDLHYLKSPSAKVHLCVPLKEVYEHPGVNWPLSFQVGINEQFVGYSRIVTQAPKVKLNSVDVPAGALEAQNKAPPEDVQHALMSCVRSRGAPGRVEQGMSCTLPRPAGEIHQDLSRLGIAQCHEHQADTGAAIRDVHGLDAQPRRGGDGVRRDAQCYGQVSERSQGSAASRTM